MGIYDREYYRDKTRGGAWLAGAQVCRAIIVLNVLVIVLDKFFREGALSEAMELRSRALFGGLEIWRLLTYPFFHDHPFQLLGNMLFLWMVGRDAEELLGSREFAWLYGSSSVVGGLVWALADRYGGGAPGAAVLSGSTGPVLAVVMLCTLYYPSREIVFFFFPVELRWLLAIYLGWTTLQVLTTPGMGISYGLSQLSAAGYGYLFKAADLRLVRLRGLFKRRPPRLRVISSDEPTREVRSAARPAPPPPPPSAFAPGSSWINAPAAPPQPPRQAPTFVTEEQLNARLDEILVKIAQSGRDSLTEDEKRTLEEASRRARSRRSERI